MMSGYNLTKRKDSKLAPPKKMTKKVPNKNKLKCYPQQLGVSSLFSPAQSEVRMYLPEPDFSICTGTFRNLT